jgi:hypothetical protein
MATITFSTTFNLTLGPKQFIFEDTADYVGQGILLASVNGCFKITSPSGIVIYNNTDFSNGGCDIQNGSSRLNQFDIALPLGLDGLPESGAYSIVYTVYDSVALAFYTVTNTYTYSYVRPIVCISQTVDCVSPLFVSTDITEYIIEGITPTIVRVHTLTFPVGSGLTMVTTSGATITEGKDEFANGTQTTQITSGLTYVFPDALTVIDSITGVKEIVVDCTYICAIYCGLRSIEQQMDAARLCGSVSEYNRLQSLFTLLMALVGLTQQAIICGEPNDVSGYLALIMKLGNFSTDCKCNDGTPGLVSGLGGLISNVVVDSCGGPITVTPVVAGNTTTYTICLSPAFITLVNSHYNTIVLPGTNITSVVDSGIIGGIRTFTVNAAPQAPPIVLNNDLTAVSTSGAGVDPLMSFSIPAGTMNTDEDVIEIDAVYIMSAVMQNKNLAFTINGVNFITKLTPSPAPNTILLPKDSKYMKVKITLTRINALALYITVDALSSGNSYVMLTGYHFDEGNGAGFAVADLATNPLVFACFGENYDTVSNTETITQNQLLVKYFNK